MLRRIREWLDRLLVPAMLLTVGWIELHAGDRRAASAFTRHQLGHELEEASTRHPDDPLVGSLDWAISAFDGARDGLADVALSLSLTFLVFSVGWLLLSRERLRFRVLALVAVWLATFIAMLTYPVY
jgi:hypothetical protein